MLRKVAMVALLVAAAACSKAGDESSRAKRTPVPPPPAEVKVPPELSIRVLIDGVPAEPITAARLEALRPDFADADRRAWRLDAIVPSLVDPTMGILALGEDGVGVVLDRRSIAGLVPVLLLTRRGEVVAALVPADDPFPDYHGSGGRLRRPGDPLPRISPVDEFRLVTEGARATGGRGAADSAAERISAARTALEELEFARNGERSAVGEDRAARVPILKVPGDDGATRVGYSLRDVVALIAPGARAIKLTTRGGVEIEVEAARWDDAKQLPVLRSNRQGALKFYWGDRSGNPQTDEVRDIVLVTIAAPPASP